MTEKRFTIHRDMVSDTDMKIPITLWSDKKQQKKFCDELNALHEENQLLKEEKELLKNKLDRIEDILPHFLSCAEISEFHGKTVNEDISLMKCWNKKYEK